MRRASDGLRIVASLAHDDEIVSRFLETVFVEKCGSTDSIEFVQRGTYREGITKSIQRHERYSMLSMDDVKADIGPYFFTPRCLTASNRQTPLATDTFRLSTVPAIGIFMTSSQVSRVRRRIPSPSAPTTIATGPSNFVS